MKYSIECFRKFYIPEFKVFATVICKEKGRSFEAFMAL